MGIPAYPQEVCPWNEKFALPLREEAFQPRLAITGRDARTLAVELLSMSDEDFQAAFRKSPLKRTKLRGLKCNGTVVVGNTGSPGDVILMLAAKADPLARAHAAWTLGRLAASPAD